MEQDTKSQQISCHELIVVINNTLANQPPDNNISGPGILRITKDAIDRSKRRKLIKDVQWSGWAWVFLPVPAYPGSPGPRAVKQLCVCVPWDPEDGLTLTVKCRLLSQFDWVVVSRPNRHKIGHFGDVSPSQSFGLAQQKHTFTNQKKCTTTQKKLKPV